MYMKRDNKHEFSFYLADLSLLLSENSSTISIADADLIHRIIFVLRLEITDECILFDGNCHARVSISRLVKHKFVECKVLQVQKNDQLMPEITILLPLLKRDSLETALYSLTEVGVNTIQLVITHKSQQKWTQKEHERALNIIHAAAEQSKQYSPVTLLEPIDLSKALIQSNAQTKLFFDPAGAPIMQTLKNVSRTSLLTVAIGPEGDLTTEEKDALKKSGFIFTTLTPTILRACQAASLSVAIVRSLIRS